MRRRMLMLSKKGREVVSLSPGLTAAALQDHLTRRLSLSNPLPPHKTHTPSRKSAQRTSSWKSVGKKSNTETDSVLREREDERERLLDPTPQPLSLAEKLGLVPGPRPQLSTSEWETVKCSSRERRDSAQPCPICHEEFGTRQQVILSCSHVFHRRCLRSVEKFSRRKTCPLCRHSNYQTRLIHDGRSHHQVKSAIRIQSWWRGVLVRRWYSESRERFPPSDPALRSRFYHRRLASLTSRMVESCVQSSSAADGVLAAADSALATARAAMRTLDCHAALSSIDWTSLQTKARETASTSECPICIAPLLPPQATPTGHAHRDRRRPISLLSCGHMLHQTCVSSLERFCTTDGELSLCPLCRAPYLRQTLNCIQ